MQGVDLPTVKKLMGHSDIQTTMIYAHLAPDHLTDAVNKLAFSG
jgi:site-specific recombinase XerD